MTDNLTVAERSERMSRIRGRDTSPERALRTALFKKGLRYRLQYGIEGRPDVAFPGAKVAVFVDGCFWHGCPDHYRPPRTHTIWWGNKTDANRRRDRFVTEMLESQNWTVVRLWSHQLKGDELTECVEQIASLVSHGLEWGSGWNEFRRRTNAGWGG